MNRKTTYRHNEHGDVIEPIYGPDGTLPSNSYVTTHEYDSEGKNCACALHHPTFIILIPLCCLRRVMKPMKTATGLK
jgi:hypothetical protein